MVVEPAPGDPGQTCAATSAGLATRLRRHDSQRLQGSWVAKNTQSFVNGREAAGRAKKDWRHWISPCCGSAIEIRIVALRRARGRAHEQWRRRLVIRVHHHLLEPVLGEDRSSKDLAPRLDARLGEWVDVELRAVQECVQERCWRVGHRMRGLARARGRLWRALVGSEAGACASSAIAVDSEASAEQRAGSKKHRGPRCWIQLTITAVIHIGTNAFQPSCYVQGVAVPPLALRESSELRQQRLVDEMLVDQLRNFLGDSP